MKDVTVLFAHFQPWFHPIKLLFDGELQLRYRSSQRTKRRKKRRKIGLSYRQLTNLLQVTKSKPFCFYFFFVYFRRVVKSLCKFYSMRKCGIVWRTNHHRGLRYCTGISSFWIWKWVLWMHRELIRFMAIDIEQASDIYATLDERYKYIAV